jgi:WD40 repeat protein
MRTPRNHVRQIHLLFFILLICTVTAFGQRERILWSKPDADPLLNVVFSNDGTILALGREDSNTTDLLNAADGSLIRPLDATHNRVNDAVFTPDDQDLIVGTGSPGDTLTLDEWRVSDGVRLLRLGAHTNGTHSVNLSSGGSLSLLDADGVTGVTGLGPIDMALSVNSHFLHALNSGDGTISAFRVNHDGSLSSLPGVAGIPIISANGLAVR